MSTIECTVCEDLMEISPEFVTEGITDTVCTSLKNDTGLNPGLKKRHTDCDDLEIMNDCLIGRPKDELEKYEVCEWKLFMKKFIWNLHEMLGGMICAICGLWIKVHDLEDRVDDLCGLLNQMMSKNMDVYGTLPGTGFDGATERKGGEINTISGSPALVQGTQGTWDGIGFYYKKSQYTDCEGNSKTYEWFQPYIRNYSYNTQVNYNDVIWKVSVTQLQDWGWTNSLIAFLSAGPQWWGGYAHSFGLQFESTILAQIQNGYLELQIIGASDNTLSGHLINGLTKDPIMRIS